MAKNFERISKLIKSKDGLEIYAEAVGDPSKPHVVFIHGIWLSGIVWEAQFSTSELLEHIYAVRYDLRGHGRSGKPLDAESWNSQRFAEDFDAVVAAFNLKRPVLVGWSYGSTIVIDIVNNFGPSYLSGVIFVGALVYTDALHIVTPWQSLTIADLLKHSDMATYPQAIDGYGKAFFANPESISDGTRQAWTDVMLTQSRPVLRHALRRRQDKDKFWNVRGLNIPLLVIHGREDRICDHDALVAEARSRFRNVEVESWVGVGHAPFLERVELFNETIVRWVEKATLQGVKPRM